MEGRQEPGSGRAIRSLTQGPLTRSILTTCKQNVVLTVTCPVFDTDDFIFNTPAQIVSYIFRHFTFRHFNSKSERHVFTGTAEGVIMRTPKEKQVWLKAADQVPCSVEELGVLKLDWSSLRAKSAFRKAAAFCPVLDDDAGELYSRGINFVNLFYFPFSIFRSGRERVYQRGSGKWTHVLSASRMSGILVVYTVRLGRTGSIASILIACAKTACSA